MLARIRFEDGGADLSLGAGAGEKTADGRRHGRVTNGDPPRRVRHRVPAYGPRDPFGRRRVGRRSDPLASVVLIGRLCRRDP